MKRYSRWETYEDGRRPDKSKLISEFYPYLKKWGEDVIGKLAIGEDEIKTDLSKLKTETMAVLLEAFLMLEERVSDE